MRRKQENSFIIILLCFLIAVAVLLAIVLVWLVKKQDSASDMGSGNSQPMGTNGALEDYTIDGIPNDVIDDKREHIEVTNPERMAYQILFQQKKIYSVDTLSNLENEVFKVTYDWNRDGVAEGIAIKLKYNTADRVLKISMEEPTFSKIECEIEEPLTSGSSVEIVGITNNYGVGIGVVSRNYNNSSEQYRIQTIIWESGNSTLTEQWNVVYSAKALPNGFIGEGDIHGRVKSNSYSYTMESNQNGYILERSTFLSDMKNLGIYMPKETVAPANIEYTRCVTGLLSLGIE